MSWAEFGQFMFIILTFGVIFTFLGIFIEVSYLKTRVRKLEERNEKNG